MVAELEQGHGDAEKQMMQMRENNNELQDEMKKAKEAWAKERNELAEAASREKGNLIASNRHLIAAMTAPALSFVTSFCCSVPLLCKLRLDEKHSQPFVIIGDHCLCCCFSCFSLDALMKCA
jgi:hypothetical protein